MKTLLHRIITALVAGVGLLFASGADAQQYYGSFTGTVVSSYIQLAGCGDVCTGNFNGDVLHGNVSFDLASTYNGYFYPISVLFTIYAPGQTISIGGADNTTLQTFSSAVTPGGQSVSLEAFFPYDQANLTFYGGPGAFGPDNNQNPNLFRLGSYDSGGGTFGFGIGHGTIGAELNLTSLFVAPVPEPSTYALVLGALAGLTMTVKRRRLQLRRTRL